MDVCIMIAVIFIIIIIFLADYKKTILPDKNLILGEDKEKNKPDKLYQSIKQKHQNKTLSEIIDYIEQRQKEDKDYWEKHRREYIFLKIKEYHLKREHSKK